MLDVSLPYDIKVAVRSGLMASEQLSIPNVPYSCLTGNCTWNAFNTLAIGVQCHNISQHLRLNCTTSDEFPAGSCTFRALGDESLETLVNGSTKWCPFMMQTKWVTMLPYSAMEVFSNMSALLAVVEWVKATSVGHGEYMKPNDTYEAVRCGVYLSVKEMNAISVNGEYSEVEIGEHTAVANNLNITADTINGTWVSPSAGTFSSSLNSTLDFRPPWDAQSPGGNGTFSMPFGAFYSLVSLFGGDPDLLNGNVSTLYSSGLSGAGILSLLFESDNTTRAIEYMARYMTMAMRSNATDELRRAQGGSNNNTAPIAAGSAVNGSVWTQQQFVVVRWAWLALPVTLLVLAIVFLLLAFIETRRAGVGLWETSPLTLLFHARVEAWPPGVRSGKDALQTAGAMTEAAADMCARIPKGAKATIEVYPRVDAAAHPRGNSRSMSRDSLELDS